MTLSVPCVAAQDTVSGKVIGVDGEPLRANVSTVANNQIVKTVTASTDGSWTLPLDELLRWGETQVVPAGNRSRVSVK